MLFKHTESNTVFDELYGTDKTISPQVANTFNLSKEQQQPQSLALKEYMLQSQYLQQNMVKSSPFSDRIMVEDSNITGNDNNSNILGALKEQQLLHISRGLNQPQVLIKIIEDLKTENEKMQRQNCRLKQIIANYERMVQQNNQQYHNQLIPKKQIEYYSQINQMLKMIQKLKQYEQKTSTLESSNKELFQKISLMRPKLQMQYRELYKSYIQRLQSEAMLINYKHQEQINDLKERLKEKELKLQSLKKSAKSSTKHVCNICRQYDLLQSLNKLQEQLEKVKAQKQNLQKRFDIKNTQLQPIQQQLKTISSFKK